MSKPNYRVNLFFDADRQVFLAHVAELEHCTAEGATRAEAVSRIEEEIDAQLANMLSHGSTPPRSVDEEVWSGEVTAKISKLLHRDLAYQARLEGIDLDHLVGELLAAALEGRRQTHRGARGGNRQTQEHVPHDNIGNRSDGTRRGGGFGGRGNYHTLLDDRANFIEYVRGLEQNGPAHPNRGGGGGGGGGDGRRRRRRNGGPGNGGYQNRNQHNGGFGAARNGNGAHHGHGHSQTPSSGSGGAGGAGESSPKPFSGSVPPSSDGEGNS